MEDMINISFGDRLSLAPANIDTMGGYKNIRANFWPFLKRCLLDSRVERVLSHIMR